VLEQLIQTYGYIALFIGTFLEGESFLLIAGLAAHRGYLDLPLCMLVAGTGSFLCDQVWFYIGRVRGRPFIERRPEWAKRAARVQGWIEHHQILMALSLRFAYGLRTITPITFGAVGFGPVRFAVLNAVSAVVWALAFGYVGYACGRFAESVIGGLRKNEAWLIVILASAGLIYWIVRHIIGFRRPPPTTPPAGS
jgi:membrane protein DedA with SNARE-associated domain